jgi:lysophospholipase L1-like esterase
VTTDLTVVGMASDRGRARWWAVRVTVLAGALVAGLLVVIGDHRQPVVQPAAAEGTQAVAATTATDVPAATTSERPRTTSEWPRTTGAQDMPSTVATTTGTTAQRSLPGTSSAPAPAAPPATAAGRTAGAVPAVEERPSVTFIGDSWAVGVGATAQRGYAVLTGEQLGWTYQALGVSGSGYTQGGGAGITFDQRVDRAVATGADIIVVQGSLNERNSTAEALAPAALATLRRLRAAAHPRTEILVVGSSYAPGTPNATIDAINSAVGDAAARVGLPFVNPAAENWIDATDPALWADPNHPNDAGHRLVADRLEPRVRATLVP